MIPAERVREDVHGELDRYYQQDDQRGYGPELHERMLDFYPGPPLGRETLAVSNAVVGLAALPSYARSAFITVDTAPIRVTFDGTAPAAAVGQHFAVAEHFTLTGRDTLVGARFIREGAADASIQVEYFG